MLMSSLYLEPREGALGRDVDGVLGQPGRQPKAVLFTPWPEPNRQVVGVSTKISIQFK
jgi:hypothetical protein